MTVMPSEIIDEQLALDFNTLLKPVVKARLDSSAH
jgi:hypothetical protein